MSDLGTDAGPGELWVIPAAKVFHCVACGTELQSIANEFPDGGLIFTSHGNYGSGLYDGMRTWLELIICDACVAKAGMRGWVEEGRPGPRPQPVYAPWTAGRDDPWEAS